ncbi:MAG: Ig-like domain-containing protein, partial [Candidatus Dormibacteraceae bacterium]
MGKLARPVSLGVLLVLVTAAGVGAWQLTKKPPVRPPVAFERFQAPAVAFKVVSTVPAKDQQNVNPTTSITLHFNQPVTPQKLTNSFFVSPTVAGKYAQGQTKDEIVFTPTVPFTSGTKVTVMLNGTFQSATGSKLGADYFYGFTTSVPDDGVLFQGPDGLLDTVSSAVSGQKQTYSLQVGNQVAAGALVTLYKADLNSLLHDLEYTDTTTDGYTHPSFVAQAVDTSTLTALSTQKNIKDGDPFNVSEGSGVYVAVATDASGKQLGYMGVVYSTFGVLLRQDDQKVVLEAQSFKDNSDVPASVTFYNLHNGLKTLAQTSVTGVTTQNLPLSPSLDIVVATNGSEQAIVPVS